MRKLILSLLALNTALSAAAVLQIRAMRKNGTVAVCYGVEPGAEEGDAQKDPVDEGFENLMRFSVNGKTGFESD